MDVEAQRPIGTASDTLMSQISVDNVVAVYVLLASQASRMYAALESAEWLRDIPPVAQDPVSRAAKAAFQPKIDHILDVHWAHYYEVQEAAKRLEEAARQYGRTDAEIKAAFEGERARSAPAFDPRV